MINHSNVKLFSRDKIWEEASQTATYLEVIQVKNDMMCPYEKFYGKKKFLRQLKFGLKNLRKYQVQ